MKPILTAQEHLTVYSEGEANQYTIVKGKQWIAAVQINGEFLPAQQEAIVKDFAMARQALHLLQELVQLRKSKKQSGEYAQYLIAREEAWKKAEQILEQIGVVVPDPEAVTEKKFICYEIWRPNIPAGGCTKQCAECNDKEQFENELDKEVL